MEGPQAKEDAPFGAGFVDKYVDVGAPPYDKKLAEQNREKFMTMKHTISEKMELYTCATKGKLDELKHLLEEKGYSVAEEVSKAGHFWTVLHYSAHYGHMEVIKYLVEDFMQSKEKAKESFDVKNDILNLQTSCGKTPLFCAILSGDNKMDQKKEIIRMLFNTDMMNLQLRKESGEDLLQVATKNSLYEFIVNSCLRED